MNLRSKLQQAFSNTQHKFKVGDLVSKAGFDTFKFKIDKVNHFSYDLSVFLEEKEFSRLDKIFKDAFVWEETQPFCLGMRKSKNAVNYSEEDLAMAVLMREYSHLYNVKEEELKKV